MDTNTNNTVRTAGWVALALAVIGALNWALVGLFELDLVAALFGELSTLTRVIYILVGLAGLYLVYFAYTLNRETPITTRRERPV